MEDKLVTIITPCYNGAEYIDAWADSILKQTYDAIEVIVVDDGSTDSSLQMIKNSACRFENRGYSLFVLKQENQGAAAAVNAALKFVHGVYIMLHDIDDMMAPGAVGEKAQYLDLHPDYGMVRNDGYYVYEGDENAACKKFSDSASNKSEGWIFSDLVLGKVNNWPGSFMIRTEYLFDHLNEREIYVSRYGQNLQIMLPVAYYYKTGYIDEPLMYYYLRKNSHSHPQDRDKELANYVGYAENRRGIIKMMHIPDEEKYLRLVDKVERQSLMWHSLKWNDEKLMKACFQFLIKRRALEFKYLKLYLRFVLRKVKIRGRESRC